MKVEAFPGICIQIGLAENCLSLQTEEGFRASVIEGVLSSLYIGCCGGSRRAGSHLVLPHALPLSCSFSLVPLRGPWSPVKLFTESSLVPGQTTD